MNVIGELVIDLSSHSFCVDHNDHFLQIRQFDIKDNNQIKFGVGITINNHISEIFFTKNNLETKIPSCSEIIDKYSRLNKSSSMFLVSIVGVVCFCIIGLKKLSSRS